MSQCKRSAGQQKTRFHYRDRALWELALQLRYHIQSLGLRPEALRPCLSEGLPSGNGKLLDLLIGRKDPRLEPNHISFFYLLGSDYVRLIFDHALSQGGKKKEQGLVETI
jgi:hypothetical protein